MELLVIIIGLLILIILQLRQIINRLPIREREKQRRELEREES